MTILIKNALVIPMKRDGEYFHSDILIEGRKIKEIKENIECNADRVIDAKDFIALPAFVDAHTHLAMVLMRNYKDDKKNLQEWLSEIFPIEDKLTAEDIYKASRLGIVELIKGGCTTFLDMYFSAHETVKAVKEANINASIGLTFVGDGNSAIEREKTLLPPILEEKGDYDRISISVAPHAIYTTDISAYKKAKEIAQKHGYYYHTHISETKREVDDSISAHNETPLEYLYNNGSLIDGKSILAHGVHLSDKEIEIAKEHGYTVVNNPSSNMKLTSGALDTEKLIEKGVNVALGTDGASSNNNLSMLKETNIAALSASLKAGVPINPYEVLKMATINGAKALGMEGRIGTLEEGKDADLILVDTKSASMNPLNNPFSALVYSAHDEDIKYVFAGGKLVLDNRKITYADETAIIEEVKDAWDGILRR